MSDDAPNTIQNADYKRRYFFITDNLVPFMSISDKSYRLYGILLSYFGMGGKGPVGNRKLAKWAHMAISSVSVAKHELEQAGFVDLEEVDTVHGKGHDIHVADITPICVEACSWKGVPLPERAAWAEAQIKEQAQQRRTGNVSPIDTIVSPDGSHERHGESTPNGVATQSGMFDGPRDRPGRSVKRLSRSKDGQTDKPVKLSTRMKKAFSNPVEQRGWIANYGGSQQVIATLQELESDAAEYYRGQIDEDELLRDITQATNDLMATYRSGGPAKPAVRFDRIPSAVRSVRAARAQQQRKQQAQSSVQNNDVIDVSGFLEE